SLAFRQFSSLPLIILLWTAASPFTPISWLLFSLEGAYLFDRFVAGILLLCACYFQFSLAGLTHPVVLTLPNPMQRSEGYVQNGRIGKEKGNGGEVALVYQPRDYWTYVVAEAAVLAGAEWGGSEIARRAVVLGVVGALWVVGWAVTPEATKRWAWGHVKAIWFVVVVDLVREVGFSRGGGRRRR
ncbi:hypothetical protein EJ04DRAFT_389540, partial [Polyplosphaeria fusca]